MNLSWEHLHPISLGPHHCIPPVGVPTTTSYHPQTPPLHPINQGPHHYILPSIDPTTASHHPGTPPLHPTSWGPHHCIPPSRDPATASHQLRTPPLTLPSPKSRFWVGMRRKGRSRNSGFWVHSAIFLSFRTNPYLEMFAIPSSARLMTSGLEK